MKVIHRCVLSLCTACALVIPSHAQALENVENWAQAGVQAAQQSGLEPAALVGADGGAPITRAEFAAVALSAYEAVSGQQAELEAAAFPDCNDPVVGAASRLGLLTGRSDGTFAPDTTINRQELCVMLASVARAAGCEVEAKGDLSQFPDGDTVDWWALEAMTAMTDLGIMSGVSTYGALTLEPFGEASRQQALLLSVRFVDTFSGQLAEKAASDGAQGGQAVPVFDVKDYDFTKNYMAEISENEKMRQVFGEGGTYYETQEQAEAAMETITVPVWRLSEDGTKRSGKAELTVNAALASVVQTIFEEIYAGGEQFPIKDVGGYAWRPSESSEHRWGTAIDINWEENYEARIEEDGSLTALTGEYWKPGEDPYSIPVDGDVVRTFKKYGFSWGGDAWSSKRDYMHFSYFGR